MLDLAGWGGGTEGGVVFAERVRWNGVVVEVAGPDPEPADDRPPVVLLHGGCHGAWCWRQWSSVLAAAGWRTYAPNWFGRFGSAPVADALGRSLRSVADAGGELSRVLDRLRRPAVLIGHSMGGFACLDWACRHGNVAALVLVAPVVPRGFGAEPIPVRPRPDRLWRPPDVSTATSMFFDHLDLDDDAGRTTARAWARTLVGESPVAVLDAVRFRLPVDVDPLRCPVRIVAGERDPLVPVSALRELADHVGAHLNVLDCGHGIPLLPGTAAAEATAAWLNEQC
ncbi:alpha/beta fold hydrolase [Saccharopolyspora sp. SCSIO 74807]|uniref:alpha/beta fold hydrolase n=1 Tax=Saccharopolyspora sp. SCSIO 74807 TaxID=3118084 RepID=UPI0030D2743F